VKIHLQLQRIPRFDKDTELKAKLKETHKLADVKESDYDAVFYPGGHGPLWDLATDKKFNRCRFL
jgi:putative intracellular protease/amidase